MIQLSSYPKVWNLGHPNIANLFDGEVVVQEKIDGSQFSFGVINGELMIRSKGATIHPPVTDKLFKRAVDTVVRLFEEGALQDGYIYRGEAMCGPKHNTLVYNTFPESGIILFDVDTGLENRVEERDRLVFNADLLGLSIVPELYRGYISNVADLKALLDRESFLGGPKIEGIVIKNYHRFADDGKMLMGKIVSEDFKEKHQKVWGQVNPGKGEVTERIIDGFRTERRWEKAIQHLRDNGELEHSPRDIGKLLMEIQNDVHEECADEIKEALFKEFWPKIKRGIVRGFPEYYKSQLTESQFEEN